MCGQLDAAPRSGVSSVFFVATYVLCGFVCLPSRRLDESLEQRTELARAHLVYGEWLRRESRRTEARVQLRTAHDMLDSMGMKAFAERARRELLAMGETVRQRTSEATGTLTDREALIARLAVDGMTNVEIGAQLFLSARTVEWHLRKVFMKLRISSRRELRGAMATLR